LADWPINAAGAETLLGLARAVFYAQARALLVSHREVYSNATVKLIGSSVGETARDPIVDRAKSCVGPCSPWLTKACRTKLTLPIGHH